MKTAYELLCTSRSKTLNASLEMLQYALPQMEEAAAKGEFSVNLKFSPPLSRESLDAILQVAESFGYVILDLTAQSALLSWANAKEPDQGEH